MNLSDTITQREILVRELAAQFTDTDTRVLRRDPIRLALEFLSRKRAQEQIAVLIRGIPENSPDYFAGKKLLEVGCGLGTFLIVAIEDHTIDAVGVEPAEDEFAPFQSISERVLAEHGLDKSRIHRSHGELLPFDDESFDLVYSTHTLEHVKNPQKVIEESIRVLKPGGYLQLVIPNYRSFFEGHYGIFWPSIISKPLGRLYVRMIGRDPSYVDSLELTHYHQIKKILDEIPFHIQILGWGEQVFMERLTTGNFSDWGAMGILRPTVELIRKLKLDRFIAHLLIRARLFTPLILTLKKVA